MSDAAPFSPPPNLRYLLPTAPSFWRWSADASCVEWADGKTIAFREELAAVLGQMAPAGFPPLDAVLLVLAATKPQWDGPGRVQFIAAQCAAEATSPTIVDRVITRRILGEAGSTLERLQSVADLPAALRQSVTAKASLVAFVFAGQKPYFSEATLDVVRRLLRRADDGLAGGRCDDDAARRLATTLDAVDRGLDRVDGDAVELWQKTGLPFELTAADVAVPPPRQTRALLAELRSDEELAGLARVAADVLAAVHVPRVLRQSDALPLGGVSDVSNKGNLDRLLISELANDDLTLSVRVAMGEALYLRREAPARHPPVGRWVVLDSGIRLWGVARLFAAAVGLALVAGGDERGTLRVFRANGGALDPVDLGTRGGLLDHLGQLIAEPDPGLAVAAAARRALEDTPADGQAELVLVTHARTAAEPGLLAQLTAAAGPRLAVRVATVTAAGAFALAQLTATGRVALGHARLSLDRLIVKPPAAPEPANGVDDAVGDPSLPTILRLRAFPLSLPALVLPQQAAYTPETGLVGLARDHRLLQWTSGAVGGRQLSDRLPRGLVRAVLADGPRGRVTVAISQHGRGQLNLYTTNVDGEGMVVQSVGVAVVRHVTQHAGAILVVSDRHVHAVTPGEAAVRTLDLPTGGRWVSGRYFYDGKDGLLAATGEGFVEAGPARRARFVFDHVTHGPVRMHNPSVLEVIGSNTRIEFPDAARAAVQPGTETASPDGRRLILRDTATQQWLCLDVDAARLHRVGARESAYAFLVGPQIAWSTATGSQLMTKLHAIGRGTDGRLVLRTRNRPRDIGLDANGRLRLNFDAPAKGATLAVEQPFGMAPRRAGVPQRLHKAAWPDGSVAWLDARGLLHLVSSDAALPQITLTLHSDSHRIAGWLSTGQYFGPAFYTLGRPAIDDTAVDRLIARFAAHLGPNTDDGDLSPIP